MGRLGDWLVADNGTLELKGYIDSTYTTHIKYEAPMSCDKDGYVRIIFSVYASYLTLLSQAFILCRVYLFPVANIGLTGIFPLNLTGHLTAYIFILLRH